MRAKWIVCFAMSAWVSTAYSAQGESCKLQQGNLLQDPRFEQRHPQGMLIHWAGSQHSGEPSFDLHINEGEATIEKVATQPWYFFRQRLDAKDLAGKKLALSVDLKFDLSRPERPQALKVGGGVKIVARSGDTKGRKLLLRSVLDHEPHMGTADWHPVQIVIQMPPDSAIVDVGFLLQAEGSMQIRNPVFQQVDESAGVCDLSPNTVLGVPRPSSGLR